MTADADPADRTADGQEAPQAEAPAEGSTEAPEAAAPAEPDDRTPWLRLDKRMILVDLVQLAAAQVPTVVAVTVFDVPPTLQSLWPVVIIAGIGIVTSVNNIVRWIKTRYRVTGDYVERRTGLFVRTYRSVRRDRIRSVDSQANLRMRVAGLRAVSFGAGQQNTAGEKALTLNAVSKATAERLRRDLIGTAEEAGGAEEGDVFARVRYRWVVYNIFNVWAYAAAIGFLVSVLLLVTTFGIDPWGPLSRVFDPEAIGWAGVVGLSLLVVGAIGVGSLAVSFFTGYWGFALSRVATAEGTALRTRQGLFRTREVNRDDARLRGAQIAEPLLWRWMGLAETSVITTGLSIWSEAPVILPRGPRSVARRVVRLVLQEEESPLDTALARHPGGALRRRLLWATVFTAFVTAATAWAGATTQAVGPDAWRITASVLWPVSLLLALAAYRALGHAVTGPYLVTRSGMMSRATTALKRKAVSGVSVRQSLLQRRLGLASVTVTTAAGEGGYEALDMAVEDALSFAADGPPGILEPFIVREPSPGKR